MNLKLLFWAGFLLLILGNVGAVYELCDSVERDSNSGFFRCNITSTRYRFTQQDIDNFWENMKKDGDYNAGRLKTVEWKLSNAVVQVTDELRFIEPEGMSLAWDLYFAGDVNTTHDINESNATANRAANHTAIKKQIGSMQEYLISIAPYGNRRGVRNITLERPSGAFAVYILGSSVKKMEIDIEGNLSLSGSYIENAAFIKAGDINLSSASYLLSIGSIEAGSLSVEGLSYVRNVGGYGKTAISLKDGNGMLAIGGSSYIDEVTGGIEAAGPITIEGGSRLENRQYSPSAVIEFIHADSLYLGGGSSIWGIGGSPGEIVVKNGISLDSGTIMGRADNKPKRIVGKSILLSNNSKIQNFTESVRVLGTETFRIESGSNIDDFSGTIDSCAPLSMDGNTTRVLFSPSSEKVVKAKALDLNNEAAIICKGLDECSYSFVEQECGASEAGALLNTTSAPIGEKPLEVVFTGGCSGQGVSCTIDFGDGSEVQFFDINAGHVYAEAGTFVAVLTAENSNGEQAEAKRTIVVTEEGVEPPAADVVNGGLSKQSAAKGEEIFIDVNAAEALESFLVSNDLGLPELSGVPGEFPARLGPFKVPEDASPGQHSFTISGKTASGRDFTKSFSFTVEGPFIPNIIPGFDFSGILLFAGIGLAVVVVVVLLLFFFVIKKRKPPTVPKKIKDRVAATKTPEELEQEKAEANAKEETKPGPEKKEAQKPGEEKPPWLEEETENGGYDANEFKGEETRKGAGEIPEEESAGIEEEESKAKPGEEKTVEKEPKSAEAGEEKPSVEEAGSLEPLEEEEAAPEEEKASLGEEEETLAEEEIPAGQEEEKQEEAVGRAEGIVGKGAEEEKLVVGTAKEPQGVPLDFIEEARSAGMASVGLPAAGRGGQGMREEEGKTAGASEPGLDESLGAEQEREEAGRQEEEGSLVSEQEEEKEAVGKEQEREEEPAEEGPEEEKEAAGEEPEEAIGQDVGPLERETKSKFSFLKKKKGKEKEGEEDSNNDELPPWLKRD